MGQPLADCLLVPALCCPCVLSSPFVHWVFGCWNFIRPVVCDCSWFHRPWPWPSRKTWSFAEVCLWTTSTTWALCTRTRLVVFFWILVRIENIVEGAAATPWGSDDLMLRVQQPHFGCLVQMFFFLSLFFPGKLRAAEVSEDGGGFGEVAGEAPASGCSVRPDGKASHS